MKDLIFSEWRRFRRLALIVTACHLLGLLFLARLTDFLQLGWGDHMALLLAYLLAGIALALVQVGSYRSPSRWLWLMHRPLAPARIFGALALSATALLALAVLVPLLATLAAIDLFTTRIVDSRHYVALLPVLAVAAMGWLAGAFACVSRTKAAIAVLVAPLLLALHLASVWALLPLAIGGVAWLATIARHGFRADRAAPITGTGVLLLTALPLQIAFFLLLFHLSKATIQIADELRTSRHHETVTLAEDGAEAAPAVGGFAAEFVAKGLQGSADTRAASWREQLPLLEFAVLINDVVRFPVRHQFGNVGAPWWDGTRATEWTFSHDRMQFHGREPVSGEERGWWGETGAGSAQPFARVPLVTMTRDTLYAIDPQEQRQHALVRLPPGETFTGAPVRALDRLLLLTDRRLLAYRSDPGATAPFAPPLLDWEVVLPDGATHLAQVDVAGLMDGWLVSFFHDPVHEYGGFESVMAPWQRVVHVDAAGAARLVGERHGVLDHRVSWGAAPLVPSSSWWLSPVLHAIARGPGAWLDAGLTRPPRLEWLSPVPAFRVLALALMALSLLLAAWWLRGTQAAAGRRRVWLASCAVLGLPAFLSLVCLEPRRPRR